MPVSKIERKRGKFKTLPQKTFVITAFSHKLSLSEVKIKIIAYSTMQEKHISRSNNHKKEFFAYK